MSSVNRVLAIPTIASCNVSKGRINQLTRVMALAFADKGIRVNAVAPSTIATELAAKAVLTCDEAKAKIMSRTPMKRLGAPSEIALNECPVSTNSHHSSLKPVQPMSRSD